MNIPEDKLNIVIADDDADDQFFIQKAIREFDPNQVITSVYNGLQLMDYLTRAGSYAKCHEPLPDLIILDINMPLMNGFDVLKKIKAIPSLKSIPVYVLSTSRSPQDKERILSLGARDFYHKANTYNELKAVIEKILPDTKL